MTALSTRASPRAVPDPTEIRAARKAAGLTQQQAADLLYTSLRAWQQWEYGERPMHASFWELFRIKAGAARATPAPSPLGPA